MTKEEALAKAHRVALILGTAYVSVTYDSNTGKEEYKLLDPYEYYQLYLEDKNG